MQKELSLPDLGDRFVVDRALSRGYLASVWLVTEVKTGNRRVAKVFDKAALSPEIAIYLRHLQQLAETLPLSVAGQVLLPRFTDETPDIFYQIFDFISEAVTLENLIESNRLSAHTAFDVLAQLASGLATLHENKIIHADVKPFNILVDLQVDAVRVQLIDFGMVQPQSDDTVLLVGTFDYLHPTLRSSVTDRRSGASHIHMRGRVGPYIDLYSAGVVALEMLVGDIQRPTIMTDEVIDLMLQRNQELRARNDVRNAAANLIARMLSVKASEETISAQEVMSIARNLLEDLLKLPASTLRVDLLQKNPSAADPVLARLEDVAQRLAQSTATLVDIDGNLRLAVSPEQEQATISDINATFANALRRARVSWHISLFFTIVVFVLIAAMIALAVALSVRTGEKQWGLIFGSAAVPLVLGILVWNRSTSFSQLRFKHSR